MNPILDIAKIEKWITNDNVPDHALTTENKRDLRPIQNNPFPTP